MSSIIVLYREQMSRRHLVPGPIDVTVKTAKFPWKWLAPTWAMVMGHKSGAISDAAYTEQYLRILESVNWDDVLKELLEIEHVTFLCYCSNGAFCHTHLLINYMLENWPHIFIDGRSGTNLNRSW
jgi:hypothetical protein